jgi:hypothetical protein
MYTTLNTGEIKSKLRIRNPKLRELFMIIPVNGSDIALILNKQN